MKFKLLIVSLFLFSFCFSFVEQFNPTSHPQYLAGCGCAKKKRPKNAEFFASCPRKGTKPPGHPGGLI